MAKSLRAAGISVQAMADYLGVARNTVGTWTGDKIKPGKQTLRLWALRTGVPLEWLEAGNLPHPAGPNGGDVATTNDYSSQDTSRVLIPFPQVTGPGSAPCRRAA